MVLRGSMSRPAKGVWELWQQQRRSVGSVGGISAPSSKSLWDVVQREQVEKHNAQQVSDIWMEVSPSRRIASGQGVG